MNLLQPLRKSASVMASTACTMGPLRAAKRKRVAGHIERGIRKELPSADGRQFN